MAEYTLTIDQSEGLPFGDDAPDDDGEDVCGTELDRGGTCERPAGECPYH